MNILIVQVPYLAGRSCVTSPGMSTQIQDRILWIHNGVNIQAEWHRKVTLNKIERTTVSTSMVGII